MRAQKSGLGIAIVLFTLVLGVTSFAQDVPLYQGLVRNAAMSDQALQNLQTSFESVKQGLNMLKPQLPPDQGMMIDQVITMIDAKLAALLKIDVYTISENMPGDAFTAIRDFYQTKMTLQEVDSMVLKQQLQAATQGQGIPLEMMQMFPIPQASIDQLLALLDDNKFQAASGGLGKSRISIMTVYVNPVNYEVIEGTTVVIATDR